MRIAYYNLIFYKEKEWLLHEMDDLMKKQVRFYFLWKQEKKASITQRH